MLYLIRVFDNIKEYRNQGEMYTVGSKDPESNKTGIAIVIPKNTRLLIYYRVDYYCCRFTFLGRDAD